MKARIIFVLGILVTAANGYAIDNEMSVDPLLVDWDGIFSPVVVGDQDCIKVSGEKKNLCDLFKGEHGRKVCFKCKSGTGASITLESIECAKENNDPVPNINPIPNTNIDMKCSSNTLVLENKDPNAWVTMTAELKKGKSLEAKGFNNGTVEIDLSDKNGQVGDVDLEGAADFKLTGKMGTVTYKGGGATEGEYSELLIDGEAEALINKTGDGDQPGKTEFKSTSEYDLPVTDPEPGNSYGGNFDF